MSILWLCLGLIIIGLIYCLSTDSDVEHFESKQQIKKNSNLHARSVALFNPSAYTGIFVRKFESPSYHTRTNTTFPLYNQNSITHNLDLKGSPQRVLSRNVVMSPWNIPEVFPLVNRRSMLL